ncbi:MAG: VPLPA-CTERM sorting domain-containing protein [Chromatiales bacterium]|nr:VPLPA-CTERM sorting domain-containing protein [Chromatiales bacterium]
MNSNLTHHIARFASTAFATVLVALPAWADGRTDIVARTGAAAPDFAPGVVFERLFGIGTTAALNDAGQVAYVGTVQGPGVTAGVDNSGIWVGDTLRVRRGDSVPGFAGLTFGALGSPVLNADGDIAFRADLGGASPGTSQAVFRNDTLLARQGDAAIGTDLSGSRSFGMFRGGPAINAAGEVAWAADVSPGFWSIWRNNDFITRAGATPPSLDTTLNPLYATRLSLNDNGQVAYRSFLSAGGSAIFIDNHLVLRTGDAAPGLGPGATFNSFFSPALNNAGEVTFRATLDSGTSPTGIWQGNRLIVRTGDEAPGVPGARFATLTDPVVNDGGQVAFGGNIESGAPGALTTSKGIWIYGPNGHALLVVRPGDVIGGRTVADTAFSADDAGLLSSPSSLNNSSQFAYLARFTDGSEAVLRFTPDLRWIADASGSWDDVMGWTIAQRPGAVHDVAIAPDLNLTVTGPSAATSVRRLTIGGGSGVATLDLAGAELTSGQRITVEATGRVVGSGVLDGPVLTNFGNLSVGRDETMTVRSSAESIGNIDVIGGSFQATAQLFNASGGAVLGVDAEIGAGNMLNQGSMQFIGDTTVSGSVNNRGGEITTLAGQTTYTGDVRNDGVITTGFGDTSRFLAGLSGTGSFAGPGTVEVLGRLSPGASPGLVSFGGDLLLGPDSVTVMELGGTVRGTGYDAIDVAGLVTLGGLLQVVLIDGFVPEVGDRFELFRAQVFAGGFDSIELPSDMFLVELGNGSFEVHVVPLPAAAWLFGSAILGLAALRRRRRANAATWRVAP